MAAQRPQPLTELARILWAARIDAFANLWHINRTALPALKTLAANATDAHLPKAVEHAEAAIKLTEAMLEELRATLDLIPASPAA